MRTQVGIIGAGPAGLFLAHLLHLEGIESVVLEDRSRKYIEERIRAGVLEQWAVDLMVEIGVGERMMREGLVHNGINLAFNGELHNIDFRALVDKGVTVYGQHEVVKDMVAARLRDGGQIEFEASVDRVVDITSNRPKIHYRQDGQDKVLECDFIGGCDGFHGISRPSLPADLLVEYDRIYPFGWLGILAESPPPDHELIYSYTDRGFALYSMRARHISRLYLQCDPEEDLSQWPDERIWDELDTRLQGTQPLQRGKVVQKGVTAMRSFVAEPMQHGRLFLAGDAAHIVPPTGAKGMNLAVADVLRLSRAIAEYYRDGGTDLIEGYSAVCLRRIWKAQRFSWWMTQLLHLDSTQNAFDRKRQLAELDYVTSSDSAERTLAENYVGLPID